MPKPKKDIVIPSVDVDADESLTSDEALAKVAMTLATTKKPELLSDINEAEIKNLAALSVVAINCPNLLCLPA